MGLITYVRVGLCKKYGSYRVTCVLFFIIYKSLLLLYYYYYCIYYYYYYYYFIIYYYLSRHVCIVLYYYLLFIYCSLFFSCVLFFFCFVFLLKIFRPPPDKILGEGAAPVVRTPPVLRYSSTIKIHENWCMKSMLTICNHEMCRCLFFDFAQNLRHI